MARVGLAQIAPRLGDVEANLAIHSDRIQEALGEGLELLVFPELSLTGYYVKDLVPRVAQRVSESPVLRALAQASGDLDLVVGFVEEDERNRFFISAAYLADGEVRHLHRKVYLPTYGMFEDNRFFSAGNRLRAFQSRFGATGLLICEDAWHLSSPYILWLDGADLLIEINASPGYGVSGEAETLAQAEAIGRFNRVYAELLTSYLLFCNRVGTEDGAMFWGGSAVFGPTGEVVAQAPLLEETLLVAEIDLNEVRRVRSRLPLLGDERLRLTLRELTRIHWKDAGYPDPDSGPASG